MFTSRSKKEDNPDMNADRALPRADPRAVVAEDDSDNSRNFVCLETSPMCRRDVLRVWLIVVAALRLLSVVIALMEPQHVKRQSDRE